MSENPRKGFFYNRWIGGWTKSKNKYLFELYITQAVFLPLSWNFTTTRSGDSCFWATLLDIRIRCPKKHLSPWKIPWSRAKERLSDVGFEHIFVFKFCSSPHPEIVKNLFADFRKFWNTKSFMNLHNFPYFTQPKNPWKKNWISFSSIPY